MNKNGDLAIFGMVKLHNFMIALRMRRNKLLLDKNIHPFSYLQRRLGAGEHWKLIKKVNMDQNN
jgi:hypothetical protein